MSYKYKLDKATQQFLKVYHAPKRGPVRDLTLEDRRKGYAALMSSQLFGWGETPDNGVTSKNIYVTSRHSDRDIPCTVYYPPTSAGLLPKPCFLYAHGGGWTLGEPKAYDNFVRKVCAKIEAVCISVDYARGPEVKFPGAVHDFYDVFKYVASGDFGDEVDSSKIAVSGDSAGGNLAAVISSLAVKDGLQKHIKLQAPLCGVFDCTKEGVDASRSWDAFGSNHFLDRGTMEFFKESYFSNPDDTRDEMASPLLASSFKDLPRTYIAACSHDPLVSDSIAYKKKLETFNVEHALKIFPGIHIFWMLPKACQDTACEEFIDTLCEHVKCAFANSDSRSLL